MADGNDPIGTQENVVVILQSANGKKKDISIRTDKWKQFLRKLRGK